MNQYVDLISTLGFPIVVALALAYAIYKFFCMYQSENSKREDRFLDTISEFSNSVEKLTTTLSSIDTRLTCIENAVNEKEI